MRTANELKIEFKPKFSQFLDKLNKYYQSDEYKEMIKKEEGKKEAELDIVMTNIIKTIERQLNLVMSENYSFENASRNMICIIDSTFLIGFNLTTMVDVKNKLSELGFIYEFTLDPRNNIKYYLYPTIYINLEQFA